MAKSRKIQVTLEDPEYELLARIASREHRKLASIVRESIHRYSILPESERTKRKALEELFSLPPASIPENYKEWKLQYHDLKKGKKKNPA